MLFGVSNSMWPRWARSKIGSGCIRTLVASGLKARPRPVGLGNLLLDAGVEASGPHDFTAPLKGRDDGINKAVSTKARSEIFLQRGLATQIDKPPYEANQPMVPSVRVRSSNNSSTATARGISPCCTA